MGRSDSICVLVSGGLDSDVLLGSYLACGKHVQPIFIRQGLAWERIELYWLKRFLKKIQSPRLAPLRILDLPMTDVYGAHWSTGRGKVPGARTKDKAVFLPGRNLVLLLKAAILGTQLGSRTFALGSLGQNPFPDASPQFFRKWGQVLSQGLGRSLKVEAPFRSLSKREVVKRGCYLPLELSFSCLAPKKKKHCGRCNKCAERRKAFRLAKARDLTRYASA